MEKLSGKWKTLDGVLEQIWMMLDRGVTHYNDPFHWPVLGTGGKEGTGMRCVILREFLLSERLLVCHTDARAAKVHEIAKSARVTWLFYHPQRKVQLRISGEASLHTDDSFADRQWNAIGIATRLNYCAVEPPGTPLDRPSSGLPDFLLKKAPTVLDTEKSRRNFMAIACRIDSIDWLVLQVMGNRRARFEWDKTGMKSTWLVP
jgi:hypothetical protein